MDLVLGIVLGAILIVGTIAFAVWRPSPRRQKNEHQSTDDSAILYSNSDWHSHSHDGGSFHDGGGSDGDISSH